MAAVSAPYASTSVSSFTPPTSSHGAQNAWSYSVPLENQLPSETANNYDDHETIDSRRPLAGQTNGHLLSGKSSRTDLSQIRPPSRSNQLQIKGNSARIDASTRKNNPMSEPSSDEYHSPTFQDGAASNGRDNNSLTGGDFAEDDDPEHSRWIHKDKLERMEHEEMERLGIKIPRSRAASRSNGRSKSRDAQNRNEQLGQHKRQKVEATSRDEEQESDWDLRLPEERDVQGPFFEQVGGNRSVSRIPVCKTSPMPIPIDFIARDTPMQYSKIPGPVGADDAIPYSKSRGRSGSIKLLGNAIASNTPVSSSRAASGRPAAPDVSPTKKTGPRKASIPLNGASNQQRTKTRSGSNGTRPVTRSGDFGSGSVSRRPEGDPPWLATMYKPDPRLPPDQQILPTHAKRMHQEQWEKDGKFGNTYDTSFRPLNIEDFGEQPKAVSPSPEVDTPKPDPQPELQPGWPLRSPKSPTLSTGRPGTAGGGSYSTMPKISSPRPQYSSPMPSPSITQITSTLRVPEAPVEEEETVKKKEAGCACCIVM